ncbi:hypothetical protein [Campylobacter sp. MG1]|uniref:hypothetical protein n=1 Tax=Campylobacter sp. MG1 TaxID=2976332 RepID=UPI00226D3849|nr:hypothetical protein [Campylobacter sp. MG1]
MKINVTMETYEYAELCAERICKFWLKDNYNFGAISNIIEDYIDGMDTICNVMDFADNFWVNYSNCQFGSDEIVNFIIDELGVDIDDILEQLELNEEYLDEVDDEDYISKAELFKEWLDENCDNLLELNDYLQEKTEDKGFFKIIYGESKELCSYLVY